TQQHFTHSAVRRLRLFRSDPGILGTRFGRITWSYMPDGISIESAIPQGSEPPGDPVPPGAITKLFARLAEPPPVGFGSQRAWQTIVANCFARWEAISGVTFEFAGNGEAVADDENGDSGERWDQNA